jgi:DNA modification methylase
MVITSPPYWNLRDYNTPGQLGQEPTYTEYLDKLIAIFAEVKRVLKPTGTCWVNLGDTYNSSKKGNTNGTYGAVKQKAGINDMQIDKPVQKGLPHKSLCCIPDRFKLRMVDELGFTCRNEIIWHKPNSMPQSVKDRFAVDYEKLFFFTKSTEYYFDTQYEPLSPVTLKELEKAYVGQATKDYAGAGAQNPSEVKSRIVQKYYNLMHSYKKQGIGLDDYLKATGHDDNIPAPNSGASNKEPYLRNNPHRARIDGTNAAKGRMLKGFTERMGGGGTGLAGHNGQLKADGTPLTKDGFATFEHARALGWQPEVESYGEWYFNTRQKKGWHDHSADAEQGNGQQKRGHAMPALNHPLGRIKRSVWRVPVKPFKDAHFAVFPAELIETPIKAGCPQYVCSKCGTPSATKYTETRHATRPGLDVGNAKSGTDADPNKTLHNSDLSKYREAIVRVPDGLSMACSCNADTVPGIVLDPFMGAGTTAIVAKRLGRDWLGIELKQEYVDMALKRIGQV